MGMYDTIHLICPTCGEDVEEQTKAGDCVLADYTLDTLPKWMLLMLDGDEFTCSQGHKFHISVQSIVQAQTIAADSRRG